MLLELLRRGAPGHPAIGVADRIVATVRRSSQLEPTVDFALAALARITRMPDDAGEVIFAIARSAGWIAHGLEEYDEEPLRFRARAVARR